MVAIDTFCSADITVGIVHCHAPRLALCVCSLALAALRVLDADVKAIYLHVTFLVVASLLLSFGRILLGHCLSLGDYLVRTLYRSIGKFHIVLDAILLKHIVIQILNWHIGFYRCLLSLIDDVLCILCNIFVLALGKFTILLLHFTKFVINFFPLVKYGKELVNVFLGHIVKQAHITIYVRKILTHYLLLHLQRQSRCLVVHIVGIVDRCTERYIRIVLRLF